MNIKTIYKNRINEEIKERWDKKAPSWDVELRDDNHHLNLDNAYKNFLSITEDVIKDKYDYTKESIFLDLGCGTGIVSQHIARYFKRGIGIDISDGMIKEAKSKNINNVSFKVGDCFQVEKLSSNFGAVISRGILISHYGKENSLVLLGKIKDILEEKGILIFDFLNKEAKESFRYRVHDKAYYTKKEIEDMAKKLGYKQIKIYGNENNRVLIASLYK